jgi:hypothetical protein
VCQDGGVPSELQLRHDDQLQLAVHFWAFLHYSDVEIASFLRSGGHRLLAPRCAKCGTSIHERGDTSKLICDCGRPFELPLKPGQVLGKSRKAVAAHG